ncbi:JAB domain-containing protein [Aurantiacibacter rhizosphaerae]|uniref:MPN domain-containing protein n=1 Tax=Aurantiacibacter rhizosphaerae TaxID=2691582 RepID=A0A844XBX1_9SPHN|nr:JAB domain-containing protein [Aurantiacibacter rhizosphaerae]MWV27005.1 hypothetical protein [Aurantiacibacter rhizosphaerae]
MADHLSPLIGVEAEDVAGHLIARFGTIARALEASPEALEVTLADFSTAATKICAARNLMKFAGNEKLVGCEVQPDDVGLHEHLRSKLNNPVEERMHAVFLDRANMYLSSETVARGSSSGLLLRIRHLVHRALDLGASKLLIAHNHPSGDCTPSQADRTSTEKFVEIAGALDLEIVDHLIVSTDGTFSLKQGRKL